MNKIAAWMLVATMALSSSSAFAYGAIAVDDEVGESDPAYGFATGEDTADDAKKQALKYCREYGTKNCKVAVWFKKCGAYAASKKYYGYGYGDSKKIASDKALEMCGNSNCKVVVAECE